jgi:hypothetical protein
MSKRNRRRADGSLRPTIVRRRARRNKARDGYTRKEWLAQFKPGDRDRFFRHVVLDQAVFLRGFAKSTGLERAEASELLERTANERRWRKLRTSDGTVVGIAPPTCGFQGCTEPAGDTQVEGVIVERVGERTVKLRICDGHADVVRAGALTAVSFAEPPQVETRPAAPMW